MDIDPGAWADRSRLAWWALTLVLAGAVSLALYSFVGTFALGLFVYYGTRPLYERVNRIVGSSALAASTTLFLIALPVLLVVAYIGFVAFSELLSTPGALVELVRPYVNLPEVNDLRPMVQDLLENPAGSNLGRMLTPLLDVLGRTLGGLFHLFFALAVAFYLLRDGDRLANWFRTDVSGEGGVGHAYVTAVDRDLESLYFGYFLLVFVVAGGALVLYHGFNVLAPGGLTIPLPTFLAVLTGLTSLVPIVVSKLVYVPVTGYLALQAARGDGSYVLVAAFFAVSLFLLDLFPQVYLLPRLAGRRLHTGLVMFSFLLGSMLFGWYGLFFGPLLLVLVVHLARIVFADLARGTPLTPGVDTASSLGADPKHEDGGDDEDREEEVDADDGPIAPDDAADASG